ncbi:MAG: HAMP domain-containing histidine kinase [Oscillospiraceae bacterium]|nr:HAMP domain-containing histidine kinase [Oscillospiraceae bacterium]
MEKGYLRLYLLLLGLAAGVCALSAGLGALMMEGLKPDGGFLAAVIFWILRRLFGFERSAAAQWYREAVVERWSLYAGAVVLVFALLPFFLILCLFVRYLKQISQGLRQTAAGEPSSLPRRLSPIQRELDAIGQALREREEQRQKAEQRRGERLVYLAHDLKTPLTSVIGYLTLLRDRPELPPQERAKYTDIALDKTQRLEELTGEFFQIARQEEPEAGTGGSVQLSLMLEQLAEEFMPSFQEKNLHFTSNIQPRLMTFGNADKLARVFDNVLRNAVSYSVPGGRVSLTAGAGEGRAEVVIRNEGLGIPEHELPRIFEKFYRLDSARSGQTGGAGLGLAIAKEIVEAHGGDIHAESNGRQTAFIIRLPGWQAAE